MPRITRSDDANDSRAAAASRALRSVNSSRYRCVRRVGSPAKNLGNPPGCVVVRSRRVRGVSEKNSSGEGPPNCAISARHA